MTAALLPNDLDDPGRNVLVAGMPDAGLSRNRELSGNRYVRTACFCALLSLLVLLSPERALALQTHGPPEGLYVHQMAHVHFICALCYLFWDIRRSCFTSKGWRYLQIFCLLMLCWNILAFAGHVAGLSIDTTHVEAADGYLKSKLLGPLTWNKVFFYLAKLDHFICVPALFFFYIGMRSFYRSVQGIEPGRKKS